MSIEINNKVFVNTFVVFFIVFTVAYFKGGFSTVIYSGSSNADNRITVEGEATDRNVINTLKRYYLDSPPIQSYGISYNPEYDPSQGQSKVIRKIFNDKTDGLFVECGAVDGVFLSNTLYLERALHWRGLLIEPDTNNYANLQKSKRNAYTSNTCLSVTNRATISEFSQVKPDAKQDWWFKGIGKLSDFGTSYVGDDNFAKLSTKTKVQCFPFYSYMLTLNISTIDYFSLDVEGAELEILKTIPFDKVEIKVLSVEWLHHRHNNTDLDDFLASKGYHELKQIKDIKFTEEDKIFIKDGVTLN